MTRHFAALIGAGAHDLFRWHLRRPACGCHDGRTRGHRHHHDHTRGACDDDGLHDALLTAVRHAR